MANAFQCNKNPFLGKENPHRQQIYDGCRNDGGTYMEKEKLIRIFDKQASMYDKRRKELSDRK